MITGARCVCTAKVGVRFPVGPPIKGETMNIISLAILVSTINFDNIESCKDVDIESMIKPNISFDEQIEIFNVFIENGSLPILCAAEVLSLLEPTESIVATSSGVVRVLPEININNINNNILIGTSSGGVSTSQ